MIIYRRDVEEKIFPFQFYVFNANPNEVLQKQFNLRYSCANNVYERYVITDGEEKDFF